MWYNGYSLKTRKKFDLWGKILASILEGESIEKAANQQQLSAKDFKTALPEIRKVNPEAYSRVLEKLMDDNEFLFFLEKDIISPDINDQNKAKLILSDYIKNSLKSVDMNQFKFHIEFIIRFKNYRVYTVIANELKIPKLAP